jgi:hypothetical protein
VPPLEAPHPRVEEAGERHLEDLVHLALVAAEGLGRLRHQPHHRRHHEAGDHRPVVELPGHLHVPRLQGHFLARLPQRRGAGVLPRLAMASREGDLAPVVL